MVLFENNGSTLSSNSTITLEKKRTHNIKCFSEANPQVTCTTSATCKNDLNGEVGCTSSIDYNIVKDEQCILTCTTTNVVGTTPAKGELYILFV